MLSARVSVHGARGEEEERKIGDITAAFVFVFKLELERGHLLGNADFNSKGSRNIFRINVFDLLVIDGKVFQVLLLNISGYIYQMYNCMQFFLVLRVE